PYLDDGVPVVERIARQQGLGELLLERGEGRLETVDFRARLGRDLRLVERGKLAGLGELGLELEVLCGRLANRDQPRVFAAELGELGRFAVRRRVGEKPFDLLRPGEGGL